MSSNRNQKKGNNGLYWLATLVAFTMSPPLGVLMAAAKLISIQNDKKENQTRERWEASHRQYSQNWQANTQGRNRYVRDDYQPQEKQYTDHSAYDARYTASAGSVSRHNRSAKAAGRRNGSLISKLTSPRKGHRMMIGGGVLAGFFGFATVLTFLEDFWLLSNGWVTDFLAELVAPIFFTGLGVLLFVYGRRSMKRSQRNREYISIIGSQNAISIREIARITNQDIEDVCEDLNRLIYQGALGEEAYIDQSSQQLILNQAGREAVRQAFEQARKNDAARRQADESPETASETPEFSVLTEIRKVNDDIDDVRISEQIDRIEEITRLILQYQTDHPESRTQLHKFLSYYLPTTLKLLQKYAEFEDSSVQGTNITETRNRIEALMDTVVSAFEQQYDQLYADARMDIESEITVLENMMKQDGLTADENENPFSKFRTQGQP